jgi:hypothetical protein
MTQKPTKTKTQLEVFDDEGPPEAPTNLALKTDNFELSWDPVDCDEYELYWNSGMRKVSGKY